MINVREKGANGEREIFKLVLQLTGIRWDRNLDSTREGGADCIIDPEWAPEVKRREEPFQKEWWEQTLRQANGKKPVLFFRRNRQPWQVAVRLRDVNPAFPCDVPVFLSLETFCLQLLIKRTRT